LGGVAPLLIRTWGFGGNGKEALPLAVSFWTKRVKKEEVDPLKDFTNFIKFV
jgi:hypothetical protein